MANDITHVSAEVAVDVLDDHRWSVLQRALNILMQSASQQMGLVVPGRDGTPVAPTFAMHEKETGSARPMLQIALTNQRWDDRVRALVLKGMASDNPDDKDAALREIGLGLAAVTEKDLEPKPHTQPETDQPTA